jgi:DNA-directed RNA polymerase specialized sigma24 family protein
MSLSASIAPHLPYLRRFARALTGSQASGDAYAIATLEAITADAGLPSDSHETKRHLFRVFLKIWSSMPINQRTDDDTISSTTGAADRNLGALTPLARVAFLLRALEGFTNEEISGILGISDLEVDQLLERAGKEIAAQLSTDVLIIEDESVIAMELEALVTDLGHRVTRIARTRREAVAAVKEQAAGLVLADIHLADGSSGVDAVNEILSGCSVPVVFITAYPERLLTGQRPEPAFLITKPFNPTTVMAIVSQALFFNRRASLVAA